VFCTAAPCRGAEVPKRLVSLAPSVTEILFALGVGDRLVGVSTYCDYPAAAKKIERVGTFLLPNVERILAVKPDLVVVVPSPENREPVLALQKLGLHVLVVDPEGVEEVQQAIRTVASAVGAESAGDRLVQSIRERLAQIEAKLAGAPPRKVLMVVGHNPLVAVGKGNYQDQLIRLAHGVNVAAATGEQWPNLSLEYAVAQAPEVIIDAAMGSEAETAAQERAFWKQFSTIPAVREGRIYGTRADELLRAGPRVAETLERLAAYVHPERFGRHAAGDESAAPTVTPRL
jgi:cobalamin transport system substrate-binding protein